METEFRGFKMAYDKLSQLQAERWTKLDSGLWTCRIHGNTFDLEDDMWGEPCWSCYDECKVEL